jgi:hypothetical protein
MRRKYFGGLKKFCGGNVIGDLRNFVKKSAWSAKEN